MQKFLWASIPPHCFFKRLMAVLLLLLEAGSRELMLEGVEKSIFTAFCRDGYWRVTMSYLLCVPEALKYQAAAVGIRMECVFFILINMLPLPFKNWLTWLLFEHQHSVCWWSERKVNVLKWERKKVKLMKWNLFQVVKLEWIKICVIFNCSFSLHLFNFVYLFFTSARKWSWIFHLLSSVCACVFSEVLPFLLNEKY